MGARVDEWVGGHADGGAQAKCGWPACPPPKRHSSPFSPLSHSITPSQFLELPGALGVFIVWGVTLPTIYVLASSITSLVFKDALILKVGGWVGGRVHATDS